MQKIVATLCLWTVMLASAPVYAQKSQEQGTPITVSGNTQRFYDNSGSGTITLGIVIAGSPSTMTVVTSGWMNGVSTPVVLDTYTGVSSTTRTFAGAGYDYYTSVPTWSGGANVTVTINKNGITAKQGTGAVTSTAIASALQSGATGCDAAHPTYVYNPGAGTCSAPPASGVTPANVNGVRYGNGSATTDTAATSPQLVTALNNTPSSAIGPGAGGTGSTAAPASGQLPVGNSGGTAYAPRTLSGDSTIDSNGAMTNGTATNVRGGAAGAVLTQTGIGATGFVLSPTTAGTYFLGWVTSGTAVAPSVINLATYLASANVPVSFAAINGTNLTLTGTSLVLGSGLGKTLYVAVDAPSTNVYFCSATPCTLANSSFYIDGGNALIARNNRIEAGTNVTGTNPAFRAGASGLFMVQGNGTVGALHYTGSGSTPTAVVNATNAGSGSSCSVTGTDSGITLSLNVGSSSLAGAQCVVTFAVPYTVAPRFDDPASTNALSSSVKNTLFANTTTTTYTLSTGAALQPGSYVWNIIIGF